MSTATIEEKRVAGYPAGAGSDELHINLLGEPEVTRGGQRLPLPQSKKTRALLGYLAMTGKPHRRDRLCALLWDIPDDPRGALRWSLSKLRGIVDAEDASRIVADRETVAFAAAGAMVDANLVREKLSGGAGGLATDELAALADLFRGEFLEGLELDSCPDFQSWCVAEREEMRSLQIELLEALVTRLADSPEDAIPYARKLLEIDPYNETARARLVRLLGAAGRMREAEQHYRAGLRALEEVGVAHATELHAAWRSLSGKAPAAAKPNNPVAIAEPVSAPPPYEPALAEIALVGRDRELGLLYGVLDDAIENGTTRVVLLTGEPGIGKSRLLDEISAGAFVRGSVVLSGACHEADGGRPYSPWIEALGGLPFPAETGRDEAAANTAESTAERRDRLFAAVLAALGERAGPQEPLFLRLDDFHWTDEASASLLRYVAARGRGRPTVVVLAARDGELADNAAAGRLLRDLRRESLLDEIEIGPLDAEAIAELAAGFEAAQDPAQLYAASAGNPLFALEMIRAPAGQDCDGVPPSLSRLIRDRVDGLPATAQDVLRWGAVLGDPFDLQLVIELSALAPEDVVDAVELLERHALLRPSTVAANGTAELLAFGNGTVRQAVYATLSEPRRRLMHGRAAAALQARDNPDGAVAADILRHAAQTGDNRMAARACVTAAAHCLRVFANGEAYGLAQRGVHYAEHIDEIDKVELLIELAEISYAARRPTDPHTEVQYVEELAERAQRLGCYDHARRGFRVASYLRWEQGQWLAAQDAAMRMEFASREGDQKERTVAMAEAACCLLMLERDLGQAETLLDEAGALSRRAAFEPAAIPQAMGLLLHYHGALEEAAEEYARALESARRDGDRGGEFDILEQSYKLAVERGVLKEARRIAAELADIAARMREGSEAPFASVLALLVDCSLGRKQQQKQLEAALSALRSLDAKHRLAYTLTRAAQCELMLGLPKKAYDHAAEAAAIADYLERPSDVVLSRVMLARAAEALGDHKALDAVFDALEKVETAEISFQAQHELELLLAGAHAGPAEAA